MNLLKKNLKVIVAIHVINNWTRDSEIYQLHYHNLNTE